MELFAKIVNGGKLQVLSFKFKFHVNIAFSSEIPHGIFFFKVNIETPKLSEICSKLTIKTTD